MFDTKYISSIVIIVVAVLKLFGVEVGSEGLTKWLEALVIVISGIIIAVKSKKDGNLTIFGTAKK
jgi:hypothetical protein